MRIPVLSQLLKDPCYPGWPQYQKNSPNLARVKRMIMHILQFIPPHMLQTFKETRKGFMSISLGGTWARVLWTPKGGKQPLMLKLEAKISMLLVGETRFIP